MTDNPGQAPAGWYPDPGGSSRQRYFDGEKWTEHYHDPSAAAFPGSDASRETIVGASPYSTPAPSAYSASGVSHGAYGASPQPSDMGPLDWWKRAMLEKYAVFDGRARRAEYWWTALLNAVGIGILWFITFAISEVLALLVLLLYLAILVPSLAVAIRRLHDTNKSGWWLLISIVPFGGIVLLVFLATDSDRGPNQYGPSPKY